jgi:hypothetical protein
MPDATLLTSRIRSLDAVVHYHAEAVTSRMNLPLRSLTVDVKLDHGLLVLKPITAGFVHGLLVGNVRLDARDATPITDIDLTLSNLRLEDFFHHPGPPPLEGALLGRARLRGYGDSLHKAASTADGELALVVPHGEIRQALAELLGVDALRGLGLLLTKDQSETPVRCAVADFHAVHGRLVAQTMVMDTGLVLAGGKGSVDLDTEALDLTFQGRPKSLRLIRVLAPITLRGHLNAPKLGVSAGKAPLQAAAAIGLAAVLGPLAVVLPFIDSGLARDADCAGLIGAAGAMGAPVKAAHPSGRTRSHGGK